MKKLYGVITAMTTPFTADNKVDVAADVYKRQPWT